MQPGCLFMWMRHPGRGLPYFVCITIFTLVLLFLMNFYIADLILERDTFKVTQKKERVAYSYKTLRPLERVDKKQELVERIDELNNIKSSVSKELVSLERKRQLLLDDISSYSLQIEHFKMEFERENKTIEKLKLSRSNLELELNEIKHNNQPQLEAPLRIEGPPRKFPSGNFKQSGSCSMSTCFDLSPCSLFSGFPIHVYHHSSFHYSNHSQAMVKHLLSSPFITKDPKKACMYLYVVEDNMRFSKDLNKRLASLQHWHANTSHAGINHLLINTKPDSLHHLSTPKQPLQTGKAMIAQQSFTHSEFRRDFDVVLPPFEDVLRLSKPHQSLPMMVPVRRAHLLTFRGAHPQPQRVAENSLYNTLVKVLTSVQNKHPADNFIFNFTCGTSPNNQLNKQSDKINNKDNKKNNKTNTQNDKKNIQINNKNNTQNNNNEDFLTCPPDPLHLSTFSLIPVLSHLEASNTDPSISTQAMLARLLFALRNGAVPLLLCHQDSLMLPLHGLVDWSGAVLWLPASRVTELHFYVRSFIDADIFEMRRRGRLIYERFFSSLPSSLDSLLSHLRHRLQIPPPPAKETPSSLISLKQRENAADASVENDEVLGPLETPFDSPSYLRNFSSSFLIPHSLPNMIDFSYLHSNLPFAHPLPFDAKFIGSSFGFRAIGSGWGGAGREFREALGGDQPREQFTVVILTYEREAVLLPAIARLKGLPHLNKVVIVWNSAKSPSPHTKWPEIGVPLEVLKMEVNSLNNRFLPFSSIRTEAVLSFDDDVHLRHDEIVFAFRVWRQNRDQIVGFPGRFVAFDKLQNSFFYNSNYSCEMSMVLTGAAFLHKFYLHAYTHLMPASIRSQVDTFLNCEDIAMNFLVSHMSRKPPIKVTSRWTFKCANCQSTLYDDSSHFDERHHCVNAFTAVYGYLPLLTTQFRADSILFKTRIPHDKQKCFKYV